MAAAFVSKVPRTERRVKEVPAGMKYPPHLFDPPAVEHHDRSAKGVLGCGAVGFCRAAMLPPAAALLSWRVGRGRRCATRCPRSSGSPPRRSITSGLGYNSVLCEQPACCLHDVVLLRHRPRIVSASAVVASAVSSTPHAPATLLAAKSPMVAPSRRDTTATRWPVLHASPQA